MVTHPHVSQHLVLGYYLPIAFDSILRPEVILVLLLLLDALWVEYYHLVGRDPRGVVLGPTVLPLRSRTS